jgi:uncharacterized protein
MMPMTENRAKKTILGLMAGMMLMMVAGFILTPAEAQFSPTFEFLKALKKDDYAGIKSNLMQGANVNAKDDDGRPAIIIATDMGEPAVVKFLLEQSAHVDETNKATGETALMRAAEAGDKISTGVLLYYKANVNEQDKHGETPLIKASRAGHREIVKILLDSGADVNLQDYTGQTALDHVQNTRQKAIERMLTDAGKH